MLRVIIASPYSGAADVIEANIRYARECMVHSFELGEAPFASHLLYPCVLDDTIPRQRDRALQAEYEWMAAADLVAFYIDLGWSPGMQKELKVARLLGKPIKPRALYSFNRHLEELT
jgi:hypothetical protein